MAVDTLRSEFLTWLSYNTSLSINPKNVYFQRIASENKSPQLIQWTFNNPNKRSLLFSYAQKEYTFKLRKSATSDGVAIAWAVAGANAANYISPKGPFPFANAANSITLSMNSATHTITQPRRWLDLLVPSLVSHEECKENYEYDYSTKYGGHLYHDFQKYWNTQLDVDESRKYNSYKFQTEVSNRNAASKSGWPAATTDQDIRMTEEIIAPPFDPFWPVDKSKMPDHFPWKDMSPVIANVDRIEYSETFTNLEAGLFDYVYASNAAVRGQKFLQIPTITNANMILWWYEPPTNFSVPQSIDIPAWDVREYIKDMETVTYAGANNANFNIVAPNNTNAATTFQVDSPLIQLKSMPSFIVVSARRDLDAANYRCGSLFSSNGAANTLANRELNIHVAGANSLPHLMEIQSLNVLLGNRPNVINTNIDQRRLWKITKKNTKEIPNFGDWRGMRKERFNYASADTVATNGSQIQDTQAFDDNCCHGYLILTPDDLAEDLSPGVAFPTSLQIRPTFVPHVGYGGLTGSGGDGVTPGDGNPSGAIAYKMYVHLFYSKYFLRMDKNSGGQFEEQLLNFDASRRLTEGASDSVNLLADGMSAQGSLQRLRQMNGTGGSLASDYRSRL